MAAVAVPVVSPTDSPDSTRATSSPGSVGASRKTSVEATAIPTAGQHRPAAHPVGEPTASCSAVSVRRVGGEPTVTCSSDSSSDRT